MVFRLGTVVHWTAGPRSASSSPRLVLQHFKLLSEGLVQYLELIRVLLLLFLHRTLQRLDQVGEYSNLRTHR